MFLPNMLKQLKKRWRRKRRWLSLGAIMLLIVIVWSTAGQKDEQAAFNASYDASAVYDANVANDVNAIYGENADYDVSAAEAISASLWESSPDAVMLENNYIGIDEHGVLSLFEGPPWQDKVIRSFFQIDIEFLESSLPPDVVKQLYNGIQITNLSEYNSVLSTFSDYAIEISEEVMKSIR